MLAGRRDRRAGRVRGVQGRPLAPLPRNTRSLTTGTSGPFARPVRLGPGTRWPPGSPVPRRAAGRLDALGPESDVVRRAAARRQHLIECQNVDFATPERARIHAAVHDRIVVICGGDAELARGAQHLGPQPAHNLGRGVGALALVARRHGRATASALDFAADSRRRHHEHEPRIRQTKLVLWSASEWRCQLREPTPDQRRLDGQQAVVAIVPRTPIPDGPPRPHPCSTADHGVRHAIDLRVAGRTAGDSNASRATSHCSRCTGRPAPCAIRAS